MAGIAKFAANCAANKFYAADLADTRSAAIFINNAKET